MAAAPRSQGLSAALACAACRLVRVFKACSAAAAWPRSSGQANHLALHAPAPMLQLEAEAYSLWMAGSLLLEKESDWEGALARFLRARCAGAVEAGPGGRKRAGAYELQPLGSTNALAHLHPSPLCAAYVGVPLRGFWMDVLGTVGAPGSSSPAHPQRFDPRCIPWHRKRFENSTSLLKSLPLPAFTSSQPRRKLFEELSKVGSFEQQAVCKQFLDHVEPTIR